MDYSAIFSTRASGYRDAQQAWPDIRRAELECFARLLGIQDGERVLDAPAGNGILRGYLPAACDYLALDPARDFAAACREQGLQVRCAALRATGLESESVDVVGSLAGVHHELGRAQLYAEWWRVLRPGGRLVIMDVAVDSAVGYFLNGFVDRWNSQGHRGDFLGPTDEQALWGQGFEQVQSQTCEYVWCAAGAEQMHAFMTELFGLDRQPSQVALEVELADSLDAGLRHGRYAVPWSLRAVLARKPIKASIPSAHDQLSGQLPLRMPQ